MHSESNHLCGCAKADPCPPGAIWADDELLWHVSQMLAAANKPGWAMLDPLIASEA